MANDDSVRDAVSRLTGPTLGALLGSALVTGCLVESGPEAPASCPAAVVGDAEDLRPSVIPDEAPQCAPAPAEVLGACVSHELGLTKTELQVEIEGVIAEVGSGSPPVECPFPTSVGTLASTTAAPAAEEDVRWIRIEADGESWVIALAAPDNTTALTVGQPVSASIEWSRSNAYLRYRLELRDVSDSTLWWFIADTGSPPIERTPDCLPVRLGPVECLSEATCWKEQHHAIEIDGASVSPGQQVIIDDLRFTNGASSFSYEPSCTDVPEGWRVLSGTREG